MRTALRVLTALTERRSPDRGDVEALRSYAPPLKQLAPDELACEVIQQALLGRARVHAAK